MLLDERIYFFSRSKIKRVDFFFPKICLFFLDEIFARPP